MNKFLLIVAILLTYYCDVSANHMADSLLNELDKVLSNGILYMEQKEHRLNRLKIQLEQEFSEEKQYELTYRIIDEYKSYISDSALTYINKNINIATQHNNIIWLIRNKLQYSFVLSSSGLFIESEIILKSIPVEYLTDELAVDYYKCLEMLYINISVYQDGKDLIVDYQGKIEQARDSILYYLPENSAERLFYNYIIADVNNDLDKAKDYLENYLKTLHPGTHEHARKSYNLSNLYMKLGDPELQLKHLILAVMSDVKDAVKENRALLDLAIKLYELNDIDRAFSYIQYALNDANFYNARFRYFEISKALPIITSSYQQKNNLQSDRLKWLLAFISILFICLFGLVIFLNKQMKVLRSTRKEMNATNENLEKVNQKLNHLNNELSEANQLKEEYIGYFLDLCSEYIANLEDFRKTVSNKIAAKRFDELLRLVTSSSGKAANEVKELYASFDKAFLKIYPDFVSSINNLLKEEDQFELKKGEMLNTELRIFALIRLGIADSSKIASFLRCSVQTVYNYRSKIKKSSKDEAIDIEEQIKRIGSHML